MENTEQFQIDNIYNELRRVAARYMQREHAAHTLQATALVHEAYIKLAGQDETEFKNRAHFVGVAAQLMRRILIDHARAKQADKRGGTHRIAVTLNEDILTADKSNVDLLAIDEALTRLAKMSERQAKIVELRCFGGLSIEEAAEVMEIAPATVKRDWTVARAFLLKELG